MKRESKELGSVQSRVAKIDELLRLCEGVDFAEQDDLFMDLLTRVTTSTDITDEQIADAVDVNASSVRRWMQVKPASTRFARPTIAAEICIMLRDERRRYLHKM